VYRLFTFSKEIYFAPLGLFQPKPSFNMLSSQFHLKGFEVMPFVSSNQVVGKDQDNDGLHRFSIG